MKKNLLKFVLAFCCTWAICEGYSQQLAFPGAEGFGKYATGGRNGTVYRVTNLNDSGEGSLRDAVSQSNRIVIFDVAGVIHIKSRIVVKSNIYIAGQTAPGEGITVYGDGFSFSGASNTICRYLRIRMGKSGTNDADGLGVANGSNMIFDHVSVAWGKDENFSISGQNPSNITIQNCIIAQGLLGHSCGGLIQTDGGVSIYRTLYIHNDTRNPKFKGKHQYVNNIVYNWKSAAYLMGGDSEGRSYANAVGNYFITGLAGGQTAFSGGNSKYNIYAADNWVDNNTDGILNGYEIPQSEYKGGPTFQSMPYDYPELPTIKAENLIDDMAGSVGASLPYRDDLDILMINDLKSFGTRGTLTGDEAKLSIGTPTTWNVWEGLSADEDPNRIDSDGDGIPDVWELRIGSDPEKDDAMVIRADQGGYTNIELYINSITGENSQYFLKSPVSLDIIKRTYDEVTIEWIDGSEWTEGFIIEQDIDGVYQEIGITKKEETFFNVTGLKEKTTYNFRIKAYNDKGESDYSKPISVKTRAMPLNVVDPDTYEPDYKWIGQDHNTWDNLSAENWHTKTAFVNGKNLLFDETGSGGDITIASGVEAGTIVVNGDKDYKFEGVIAGDSTLNKAGSGTLVLGNNNTFSKGTVIHDGILEIGKLANSGLSSSLGIAPNMVWKGGTLRYTGKSVSTDREIALEEPTTFEVTDASATVTFTGPIEGEGDFIKNGAGSVLSSFQKIFNEHSGDVIIREGTFEMNSGGEYNDVILNGKVILEGGRFKTSGSADELYGKLDFDVEVNGEERSHFQISRYSHIYSNFSGSGDLQLNLDFVREFYRGDWTEFEGNLYVERSSGVNTNVVWMIDNANKGGIPNARINVGNNITIWAGTNATETRLGSLSGSSGAELGCSFYKADDKGASTWIVGGMDTDETFKGKITNNIYHNTRIGTTHIVKEGEGYWRLTGANRYRGTTTINAGTLIQNGTHGKDKDWDNTSYGPKAYTVNEGGTLAGTGSTEAPVIVKDGGILAPGDFGIGTFKVENSVTLEEGSKLIIDVDRNTKTADRLTVTGKLIIAGDLEINLTDGNFNNGEYITILSAGSYEGSFKNIIPATPGDGLYWNPAQLYNRGRLYITDTPTGIYENGYNEIVKTVKGAIVIEGLITEKIVTVYNLSGVPVHSITVSDGCTIQVDAGIYFVKIDNKTTKVIVR